MDVGGRDQSGEDRAHGEDRPGPCGWRNLPREEGVLIRSIGIAISRYVAVALARAIHHRRAGQCRSSALNTPMVRTIPDDCIAPAPDAEFRSIRIPAELIRELIPGRVF